MNEPLSAERLSELEAGRFPGGHICGFIPLQPLAHSSLGAAGLGAVDSRARGPCVRAWGEHFLVSSGGDLGVRLVKTDLFRMERI